MQWEIKLSKPVERWLGELDNDGFLRVSAALDVLTELGPRLGRPLVHRTCLPPGGRELRIAGRRGRELRVSFSIDGAGHAVLLREVRPARGPRPGRHARAAAAAVRAEEPPDAARSYVEWSDLRRTLHLDEAWVFRYKSRLRSELAGEQLAEQRKARLLTQADVAFAMRVRTAKVSRLEGGELERASLGLLRAYVLSLGGELEVTATFSDQRILLQ